MLRNRIEKIKTHFNKKEYRKKLHEKKYFKKYDGIFIRIR
jgi:hypothetical protein